MDGVMSKLVRLCSVVAVISCLAAEPIHAAEIEIHGAVVAYGEAYGASIEYPFGCLFAFQSGNPACGRTIDKVYSSNLGSYLDFTGLEFNKNDPPKG